MNCKLCTGLTALLLWAAPAQSEPAVLPVPGQKLGSGLGSPPHYSKWLDRTSCDPMGRLSVTVASTQR